MANLGFFTSPMEFPSQIHSGKHCAVFFNGLQLFVELDGHAVGQMTPESVIALLAEEMQQFAESHPGIAIVAGNVGAAIPQAVVQVLVKCVKTYGFRDTALLFKHIAGRAVMTPVGAVLAAELVILTVRWVEICQKHKCSNHGGVLIQLRFPAVQVASQVWPRGGYKGERIEKAKEVLQNVGQKVGQHLQNVGQRIQQGLQNLQNFRPLSRPAPFPFRRRR